MKVGWILVAVYVVGSLAAANIPDCWKGEPRSVHLEEIPIVTIALPPIALIAWPILILSDCPASKHEDDR